MLAASSRREHLQVLSGVGSAGARPSRAPFRFAPAVHRRASRRAVRIAAMGDVEMPYTHLWASADGETHIAEVKMRGFELKEYSKLPQAVKAGVGGTPTNVIFTQLPGGFDNPWHPAPSVQFVITMSGHWYVRTSDGSEREFGPGDVLFQDNTTASPAAKTPEHYSGVRGDEPCWQMIVQVDRAPEVDHPGPL